VQKKSASVTDAGSSAGPSFNVPFTNPVSAGSLLLVTGQIHGNLGVGGVTDSLGNAYSPLFTIGVSGVAKLWYAISLAGGPCTVTYNLGAFTVSTSATTGVALEYSGVTTGGPLDGSSQNSNFISAAALWTTGSVTALGTKELMIGVFTSFYFPLPWGDFTPGVDQNPGNHTSFTLRSEDKVADPATIGEFFAIRVIDFIGAGINPSGSQEITATGSDPSGGDSYEAVGASFQPA
jgi:hypothetical protein